MTVLFDLDDTLLDHSGADRDAAVVLGAAYAPERNREMFLLDWRRANNRHYGSYLAGQLTFIEQRRARIREVVSRPLGDAEADMAFNCYFAAYRKAWRLFDDARICLDRLAGVKLAVVTNGDGALQRRKLESLGIANRFDAIVISGECGFSKPNPQIFALACRKLGAAPRQAVFIGDDRRLDVEAARAAGLRAMWIDRSGEGFADSGRLTSLADFPALLAPAG
jgi:putative hydrolase of the HAD superfamily